MATGEVMATQSAHHLKKELDEASQPLQDLSQLASEADAVSLDEYGPHVGERLRAEAKRLKFAALEADAEANFLQAVLNDEELPEEAEDVENEWKQEFKKKEQEAEEVKGEIRGLITRIANSAGPLRDVSGALSSRLDDLTSLEEEIRKDAPQVESEEALHSLEKEVNALQEKAASMEEQVKHQANDPESDDEEVENIDEGTGQLTADISELARQANTSIDRQGLKERNEKYSWLSSFSGLAIEQVGEDEVAINIDREGVPPYRLTVHFHPGTREVSSLSLEPTSTVDLSDLAEAAQSHNNGLHFAVREVCARLAAAAKKDAALKAAKRQGFSVARATKGSKIQLSLAGGCVATLDHTPEWPGEGASLNLVGVRCPKLGEDELRQLEESEATAKALASGDVATVARSLEEQAVSLMHA